MMASSCSTLALSKYLEELDDQNKILPTDEFSSRISKDVESIVQAISNEISKADGRFHVCRVIRSGSFYSGLKVGKPDEFDFMFYLDYFSKEGLFQPTKSSQLDNFFDLWVTDQKHLDELKDMVGHKNKTEAHYKLEVEEFKWRYSSLVLNAIHTLDAQQSFPDGWHQSKYYSDFDHIVKNAFGEKRLVDFSVTPSLSRGPSFTFHFEVLIEGCSEKLNVSIDMCPVFSLHDENSVLERCGFHLTVDESSWAYSKIKDVLDQDKGLLLLPARYQEGGFLLPAWKLSTVLLEDVILQEFDHGSVELKSLRILKVLRKEHLKKRWKKPKTNRDRPINKSVPDSLISKPEETGAQANEEAKALTKALQDIRQFSRSYVSDLVTIYNTHKPGGEDKDCLVSSYELKLQWLRYMIFRGEKPALTGGSLVQTIFDILEGFAKFVEVNDRSRDVFFNVPVCTPQIEDDKKAIIDAINRLMQHLESLFS